MKGFAVVVILILVIALVAFVPIITIGALNLLFATSIPLTIKTWAAALWFIILVGGMKLSIKLK